MRWKRAAGKRIRNSWCNSTYEDFISRANSFPDEIWKMVDNKVVATVGDAEKVHITIPQGTTCVGR